MEYEHVIEPFEHQRRHLEQHVDKKAWGLLWEQGTAKTKPIIDTAAILYGRGEINGLMVVAPPGVERNWASDEIPKHLPPDLALDTRVFIFKTEKKHTQAHKRAVTANLHHDGLAVFLISYNAWQTKEGKKAATDFLAKREVLMVCDEAHNIKSPGAKRTFSIRTIGKRAKYRRILTGTPVAQGPFDLYSQIAFLDEWFWKNRGIHGYTEFKHTFGEYYTRAQCQKDQGYDPGYDKLIRYRDIDKLKEWIKDISDRVLKSDVLDLPPKLYSKRYYKLSKEQRAAYDQLRDELMLEIGDHIISAELPIVKLLRLQQIVCNYVPLGEDEPVHMFSKKNPRLGPMEEVRDETYQPAIVWARFRHDVDQLMDMLPNAVRYDGSLSDDEAERSKMAFQKGDAQWFVGTAQKGGPGLTLTQAKTMVYYSNSFRLVDRLQSEDRAHRAGMDEHPVNYVDIIASEVPTDDYIVKNLRNKRDLAAALQDDPKEEWI